MGCEVRSAIYGEPRYPWRIIRVTVSGCCNGKPSARDCKECWRSDGQSCGRVCTNWCKSCSCIAV